MGTCLMIASNANQNLQNLETIKKDKEIIKNIIQEESKNSSTPNQLSRLGMVQSSIEKNNVCTLTKPFHRTFSLKIKPTKHFQNESITPVLSCPHIQNFHFRKNQFPKYPNSDFIKNITVMFRSQCDINNDQSSCIRSSKQNQQYQTSITNGIQQFVEYPFNRANNSQKDMINKGLTEKDNNLINQTLAVDESMKLYGIKLTNKSVYSGSCFHGMRQGYGIMLWNDGSVYEGFWKQNKSFGQGKLTFSNGQIYDGDWLQDKMHGYGVYTYHNEEKYEGYWINNLQQGHGVYVWNNNQKYIGQWKTGKKNGQGQLYFQDGSYFKGTFQDNQIHGSGVYCWKNIKTYNGQWQHNRMNGKGIMTWEDGRSYKGMFQNDKIEGYGVLTQTDNSISTGYWKNGRKNGLFNQQNSQGKSKQVEWYMGKKLKRRCQCQKKVVSINSNKNNLKK